VWGCGDYHIIGHDTPVDFRKTWAVRYSSLEPNQVRNGGVIVISYIYTAVLMFRFFVCSQTSVR